MTKSRNLTSLTFSGKQSDFRYNSQVLTRGDPFVYNYLSRETLVSNGHPWPPKKGQGNWDIGGNYSVRRRRISFQPGYARGFSNFGGGSTPSGYNYSYEGQVIPDVFQPNAVPTDFSLPNLISPFRMIEEGTKGWAKFKPTASRGGLDQLIGEIHQIPSVTSIRDLKRAFQVKRDKLRHVGRSTGSAYLNHVFGWVPLINELVSLADNIQNTDVRIAQLIKDDGKPVRRKGIITVDSTNPIVNVSNGIGYTVPYFPYPLYDGNETKTSTITAKTKFSFAGRFRYKLQDPNKVPMGTRESYQLQRILYGAEINAHTLYAIMPWSWAIDWASSLGALIDNAVNDPIDGLVADFAYVSAHKTLETRYDVTGRLKNGSLYQCSATLTEEVKQRTGASPYGFGFHFPDFSAKQMAILAALGLTKLL